MRTIRTLLPLAVVAVFVAACGANNGGSMTTAPDTTTSTSGSGAAAVTTMARPTAFDGVPVVTIIGPAERGAGRAPTFAWDPVDGATAYRLVVLGPDAPRWAWAGPDTTVRYGATEGEDGPSLTAGSWWSVAALDHAGTSVALSPLRAVSPGDDPGPAPAWATGTAVTASGSEPTPSPEGPAAAPVTACSLVTPAELTAALGLTFRDGAPSGFAIASDDCTFPTDRAAELNVDVAPASAFFPDLWGPNERPIQGLGDDSFIAASGLDTKLGFTRGDHSVLLSYSYGRVDAGQLIELAKSIDSRLRSNH